MKFQTNNRLEKVVTKFSAKRTLLRVGMSLGMAAGVSLASAQQMTLMTGPQGGVWVPLGGALKGMWEKAIP